MPKETIVSYLGLCRIKVSFFSAMSAAAGFALVSPVPAQGMPMATGVFLLACGSSALNQYQERKTDARMQRTKGRAIPSGKITPLAALCFAAAVLMAGLFVLHLTGRLLTVLLGVFAVLWYNGVYTYLKTKTAFAVIPGAVVGAIPPVLGWEAGGGALQDPRLAILCFVFFMWQVPHFWLLLFNYGKEYEGAGLPALSGILSGRQLQRITSSWIFAMVASCLLLLLYGMVHSSLAVFALVIVSLWSAWHGIDFALDARPGLGRSHMIFKRINYHMLFVILLVSSDRLTYTLIKMV